MDFKTSRDKKEMGAEEERMKWKKLGIEHGKVVLKEIEREYPTTVVKNVIYNTYTSVCGNDIRYAEKIGDFEFGHCGYCGAKFKHEDQNYCESCGYEL